MSHPLLKCLYLRNVLCSLSPQLKGIIREVQTTMIKRKAITSMNLISLNKKLKDPRRSRTATSCFLPVSFLSLPHLITSCLHLPSAGNRDVCHQRLWLTRGCSTLWSQGKLYLSENKQNIQQVLQESYNTDVRLLICDKTSLKGSNFTTILQSRMCVSGKPTNHPASIFG